MFLLWLTACFSDYWLGENIIYHFSSLPVAGKKKKKQNTALMRPKVCFFFFCRMMVADLSRYQSFQQSTRCRHLVAYKCASLKLTLLCTSFLRCVWPLLIRLLSQHSVWSGRAISPAIISRVELKAYPWNLLFSPLLWPPPNHFLKLSGLISVCLLSKSLCLCRLYRAELLVPSLLLWEDCGMESRCDRGLNIA